MTPPRLASLWLAGVAAAFVGVWAPPVQAQNAVITGRVTNERGEPLAGATVVVNATNFGAATNASGVYTITIGASSARGQQVTLTARYLGYRPGTAQITVTPGQHDQDFQLDPDPLRLDELVVTGVSEATSTKKLAFAVGRVDESQLQEAPGVTALGALQGKVAGVQVSQTSGEPGTAPSIRLRGSTSIGGNQNPLIIIDGVISRASLSDIASEDIERVEVIKGAAASSLYGSDAANGVIQIFTKRGANLAEGRLAVTARFEGGASFVSKRIPNSGAHWFQCCDGDDFIRDAGGNRIPVVTPGRGTLANTSYPVYYDNQEELIEPGRFFTQYVSVGQRRGNTNFNASFQNTYTEGAIFGIEGFRRQNYRVNVDQVLSDKFDLSFNAFYGFSNNNDADQGPGAPFFTVTFLEPHVDATACCNPDGTPYVAEIPDRLSNAANSLYELNTRNRETDRSRFTGGGRLRWRPTTWLSAEANYYYDKLGQQFTNELPFGSYSATGIAGDGSYSRSTFDQRTYNTSVTLTAVKDFGNVRTTLRGSYLYEDEEEANFSASSGTFVVKGVPEFSATDPATRDASSSDATIRAQNFFVIATFDINDNVILDGLVRRDGSSLFGAEARWATYYRGSAAVRLPQLLGWTSGPEELRLRASYGTAGLRPGFSAQYETLSASGGSFSKNTLGNKNLAPAHSAELEVGANIELGGGRFTAEYTYSVKDTRDQLYQVDLPSVVGFTTQWRNVGRLKAKTHEMALGYQVMNTRDIAWTMNVVGDRVRQTITEWPLPEELYGFGQMPSAFYINEGAELGAFKGNRWVRSLSELPPGLNPDDYTINQLGFVVAKSTINTASERPIKYQECVDAACTATTDIVDIGNANPDFRLGFSTNFNYRRLSVTGLVDWSQGGDIYNGTRQWPFFDNRDIIYDQRNVPEADQKPLEYFNAFYNGLESNDFFVESATFVKIRELSVNYTFVRDQLRKIGLGGLSELRLGVVGRNLFTFSSYSGYDPEVTAQQGDPFQVKMDWFQYPLYRTFTGVVEIAF